MLLDEVVCCGEPSARIQQLFLNTGKNVHEIQHSITVQYFTLLYYLLYFMSVLPVQREKQESKLGTFGIK